MGRIILSGGCLHLFHYMYPLFIKAFPLLSVYMKENKAVTQIQIESRKYHWCIRKAVHGLRVLVKRARHEEMASQAASALTAALRPLEEALAAYLPQALALPATERATFLGHMLRRQAEAELQPLRDVAAPGDVPQEEVAVLEAMLSAAMRVAADACDAPIEAAAAFLLGEPPGHPIPRVSLARQNGRGGSSKWVAGTRGERAISLKPSDYYHDAETIFTAHSRLQRRAARRQCDCSIPIGT